MKFLLLHLEPVQDCVDMVFMLLQDLHLLVDYIYLLVFILVHVILQEEGKDCKLKFVLRDVSRQLLEH